MQYYSTNHQSLKTGFKRAIEKSEASDGGLYMPEIIPLVPKAFVNNITYMPIKDLSFVISSMFVNDSIPSFVLKNICNEVFSTPIPIQEIEPDIYVMEMFHGPTRTVKDFGAAFLTRLMKHFFIADSTPHTVMVATTGYSGAAIAKGFHDIGGTEVLVIYPQGTSKIHLEVINSMRDNIHAIEVRGSIDNCKELIAKAFDDKDFINNLTLTSANSTNIGFLLPYITLYFYGYSQILKKSGKTDGLYISIPTGNCGNLLAALMAKKMGLPVTRLIAACNTNAGFANYLGNNTHQKNRRSSRTLAYGIDAPLPGNLPRFDALCNGNPSSLRNDIISDICTDAEIMQTITDVRNRTGYLLDPHSAVAYTCLKKNKPEGVPSLLLATADPMLETACKNKTTRFSNMLERTLCYRPEAVIPPTYAALKKYLNYYSSSAEFQNRV